MAPSKTTSLETTGRSTSSSASCPSVAAVSGIGRLRHLEEAGGLLALEGGADEPLEQRVRVVRARPQLGVGLGADVERVHLARELDELDQVAVGRDAGEVQAGLGDLLAV